MPRSSYTSFLFFLCFFIAPSVHAQSVPLGAQSNAPRFIALRKAPAARSLTQVGPGHFLALPSRRIESASMRLVRARAYALPARDGGVEPGRTASAPKPAAPATPPAPSKESDAAMGATVAAQAALSRSGAQLTDPIDLLVASRKRK